METYRPEVESMLQTVIPFHPLSYRTESIVNASVEAWLKESLSSSNTELIEEFKKFAKALIFSWLQDDSIIDNPHKWHNLLLKNSREFSDLINKSIHHAAELSYSLWLIIMDLVKCAGYEATNYRPPKLAPDQDFITWFAACEEEREQAVIRVLNGSIRTNNSYLHQRRLEALILLHKYVDDLYEKYLPNQFPRAVSLPSFYTVVPANIVSQLPYEAPILYDSNATNTQTEKSVEHGVTADVFSQFFELHFTLDHCNVLMAKVQVGPAYKKPKNLSAKIWALLHVLEEKSLLNCTAIDAAQAAGNYYGYTMAAKPSKAASGQPYKDAFLKINKAAKDAIARKEYGPNYS
jgi:hypothetical protein